MVSKTPPDLTDPPAILFLEYGFLTNDLLTPDALRYWIGQAYAEAVDPHHVLIANGILTTQAYLDAMSQHLSHGLDRQVGGSRRTTVWIDICNGRPSQVARAVARARLHGAAVLLGTGSALAAGLQPIEELRRADLAAHQFRRRFPALSAATRIPTWQILIGIIGLGLVVGGAIMAPMATLFAVSAPLAFIFILIVLARVLATFVVISPTRRGRPRIGRRLDDAQLPLYSVLVPLYQEPEIVPDLIASLSGLDYPPTKLDILLILEADDTDTLRSLHGCRLPPFIRPVVVPALEPRTKPKALNYALPLARGSLIVVYDAEDIPARDQLRRSVAAFNAGGPSLACLQAKLNIYNPRESWLTRQFTIEYSSLFDGFLGALSRLGWPIPLGGSSNHFRTDALRRIGGWDAHNVTEDADLGFRIARLSGHIGILDSTTWEEAPARFGPWVRQRTRWLKGWMITYLVHMRSPSHLLRTLGLYRFIGFQVVLAGTLLSALLHPVFYALLVIELLLGTVSDAWHSLPGKILLVVAAINFAAGYVSTMALGIVALIKRSSRWLIPATLFAPAYWLLISMIAYRALWQVLRCPYYWEKTPHHARSNRYTRAKAREPRWPLDTNLAAINRKFDRHH